MHGVMSTTRDAGESRLAGREYRHRHRHPRQQHHQEHQQPPLARSLRARERSLQATDRFPREPLFISLPRTIVNPFGCLAGSTPGPDVSRPSS